MRPIGTEQMDIFCFIFKNVNLICFCVQELKSCAGGDLEITFESNEEPIEILPTSKGCGQR